MCRVVAAEERFTAGASARLLDGAAIARSQASGADEAIA